MGRQGLKGQGLVAAVAAAGKLQMDRSTKQAMVLAQDVASAPAVELISGDGDLSTTGIPFHIRDERQSSILIPHIDVCAMWG